jgi:hypothetical protein
LRQIKIKYKTKRPAHASVPDNLLVIPREAAIPPSPLKVYIELHFKGLEKTLEAPAKTPAI